MDTQKSNKQAHTQKEKNPFFIRSPSSALIRFSFTLLITSIVLLEKKRNITTGYD